MSSFESFLNREIVRLPDIDIDSQKEGKYVWIPVGEEKFDEAYCVTTVKEAVEDAIHAYKNLEGSYYEDFEEEDREEVNPLISICEYREYNSADVCKKFFDADRFMEQLEESLFDNIGHDDEMLHLRGGKTKEEFREEYRKVMGKLIGEFYYCSPDKFCEREVCIWDLEKNKEHRPIDYRSFSVVYSCKESDMYGWKLHSVHENVEDANKSLREVMKNLRQFDVAVIFAHRKDFYGNIDVNKYLSMDLNDGSGVYFPSYRGSMLGVRRLPSSFSFINFQTKGGEIAEVIKDVSYHFTKERGVPQDYIVIERHDKKSQG